MQREEEEESESSRSDGDGEGLTEPDSEGELSEVCGNVETSMRWS